MTNITAGTMKKNRVLAFIAKMWISTYRYKVYNREATDRLMAEKKKLVFSIWHNQLMCVIGFRKSGYKIVTMISRSKDGGYFASLVESVGHRVVRASSSRGASQGTLEMLEEMDRGYHGAMAADGPKGPQYKIKNGGLYLAKKADRIIVPLIFDCKRFLRFNSWDKFIVPLPFAKIDMYFGDPIYVSESLDKDVMAEELASIQNSVMEKTREFSKNII